MRERTEGKGREDKEKEGAGRGGRRGEGRGRKGEERNRSCKPEACL